MHDQPKRVLVVEADDRLYALLCRRVELIMPGFAIDRARQESEVEAWRDGHKGMVLYGADGVASLHEAVMTGFQYELSTVHGELSRLHHSLSANSAATAAIAASMEQVESAMRELRNTAKDSNAKISEITETVYGNGNPGLVDEMGKAGVRLERVEGEVKTVRTDIRWAVVIVVGAVLTGVVGLTIKALFDAALTSFKGS